MELFTKDLLLRTVDDNDIEEIVKAGRWLQKGPISVDDARKAIHEYIVTQPQNAQVQRQIGSSHIVRLRRRSYGYAVLALLVGIASRSLPFERFGVGRLYNES